jgi:hypothetical protein
VSCIQEAAEDLVDTEAEIARRQHAS